MKQCCMLIEEVGTRCTNMVPDDQEACADCCDMLTGVIEETVRLKLRALQTLTEEQSERIAALEAERDEFNAGWKSCMEDSRKIAEICRTLETAMAQLRRQIAALKAPVTLEEIGGKVASPLRAKEHIDRIIANRAKETP